MPNAGEAIMDASSDDRLHTGPSARADFCTTHWSRVVQANEDDSPQARAALAQLCQTYWYPLYAYIRRRGYNAHDAEDLTQSFFARLLEKDCLKQIDRDRGRFRTFLLAALQHFVDNEWHRANALKRGGAHSFISWEAQSAEERYNHEPRHELTPERIYERRWATTLLEKAMTELKADYGRLGQTALFDALEIYLTGEKQPQSYAEVAPRLGLTEGAVKVAVHRMRRSFGAHLRTEIAQTLSSQEEEEVASELRHALAALS